jgi:hypothetical protein
MEKKEKEKYAREWKAGEMRSMRKRSLSRRLKEEDQG